MTRPVAIVGPSSAKTLSRWLNEPDRHHAQALSGGGASVNNLVQALLETGISVELVTLDPELTERITLEGSRLRILAAPYRARARDRGRDFFRVERRHIQELVAATSASVVNAHWTYEYALGALASPGRPTIVTARDAPFTILRYRRDRYRALRTAMAVATRLRRPVLAANSPYLAKVWRRQMLYRREIPVVPNVVMPVTARLNGARRPPTAPTILDVTEIGRRKNVHSLLRAMPRILLSHPDSRLRLVGPGLTESSRTAKLASQLGVRHAVEFVGSLDPDRLAEEYLRATVFVHASLEESFGMTVAEAMAHGLPVVAGAQAGAIPWVLDEGRAGLLVDMRRPEAIAGAVSQLLDDTSLRTELGEAGVQRVGSAFSPSVVSASWMQLFEDLPSRLR